MNTPGSLQGKLAIVTGVTSGIGEATVEALLVREVEVVGLGRDPEKLSRAQARFGPGFRAVCADLSDPAARREVAVGLGALGRPPDILVNNAAECVYESPLDLPPARLARLFEINVTAVLALTQAVAAHMQRGAQVVQVSSVVARHLPGSRYAPYAATKAALDCLTEGLRLELHPRGVRVSSIVPGLVDTPIYDKLPDFAGTKAKMHEHVPTWLSPADVADAIVWMLSRPEHAVVSELVLLPSAQVR